MKAATQRDATGGGAVRQSGTAAVVRLAGADGPAIQQHPPRGRRPKHVLSLWRARLARSQAVAVLALESQCRLARQRRKECFERCLALTRERKEVERRDDVIGIEYGVLDKLVKDIEAQIAQAAKGGAA